MNLPFAFVMFVVWNGTRVMLARIRNRRAAGGLLGITKRSLHPDERVEREKSVESAKSVKSLTDLFFRFFEKSQEQSGVRI